MSSDIRHFDDIWDVDIMRSTSNVSFSQPLVPQPERDVPIELVPSAKLPQQDSTLKCTAQR